MVVRLNSEVWTTGSCARAGKMLIRIIASAKNLKERIGNLYTAILSLTKLCTFEHDWSLANVHSVRVAVGPQKPPRLKALRCVGVSGGVTSWLARFWQAPASTPRWFPVQLGYRRTAPGGGKRSNQLRSES